MALFEYNICIQADAELFERQCRLLESSVPVQRVSSFLEDVDGTLTRTYCQQNAEVKVKNDMQVDALYVTSEFDLLPYFN